MTDWKIVPIKTHQAQSLLTTGLPATLPDTDSAVNTLSTNFDAAGEYHIQFKVDIDFDPGTGDDHWHGTASKEISQKVIGGAISGDSTAISFCNENSPRVPVLSAANGQPMGTTYAWMQPMNRRSLVKE